MTRLFAPILFTLAMTFGAAAQDAPEVEEMALGEPEAPVTVIEYASFTCPHCATFHQQSFDRLKEEYVDTGQVRYVYREVYFDRFGLWASLVARCAGADRYFGIVDLLYERQSEWLAGGEPAEIAENLRRLGRSAGLDDGQLNQCLQDGEKAQALVAEYQKNAEADGINSTPSFVIGGETYTNRPYDELTALIDDQIAE